jgi:ribosomal protein S18 acetylase RimI-like enzyme
MIVRVIRDATCADAAAMYRICRLTGDAGADASHLYSDPDLLGQVYVGPYLIVPPATALVGLDDSGDPIGYAVGTPDSAAFAAACGSLWWPALRAAYPLGEVGAAHAALTPADLGLLAQIHHPQVAASDLVEPFSAHLHIDLLPQAQGRGLGRALMEQLLARLRVAGATGVHLGVDPRNTPAVRFYEHLGFTRWGTDPDAVTLVLRFG